MPQVTVLIFHPQPGPGAGPLERRLGAARSRLARVHLAGFEKAGATTVRLISGPPDEQPFGARLAAALQDVPSGGLVVLGSGAIPLAGLADRRTFVNCAGGHGPMAITNNRFSSDILAVADVAWLRSLPPSASSDNALPRWLSEQAGIPVADLRARYRLGVDLDSPLDLALLEGQGAALDPGPHPEDAPVVERLARIRAVLADPTAELVIAGRTSAAALAWLEGVARCRVRALIEERGLRASTPLTADARQRPPRSVLGALLDRDGPGALGARLAELGDAALVDSRVLLAHRLGLAQPTWTALDDAAGPAFHPGRSAAGTSANGLSGRVGELHPALLDRLDLRTGRVIIGEFALAGLAGGVFAISHGFTSLEELSWPTSGKVVLITVLGGIGTLWGGPLGAATVITLEDRLASSGFEGTGIILGSIFVVIVLLFRHGIWGTARDLVQRRMRH